MPDGIDSILTPFQRFGVHLGLDRIRKLLDNLGNPQARGPIIHVAGSNGKGSVCAYCSAVLAAAGYRVGRYTSPHLIDWTERICLNEKPIATAELAEILAEVKDAIDPNTESPTQFEIITAAAWVYFARHAVDVAVIEVGLGGRLDATNVVEKPLLTAITSISREHWQNLGPTVADIAGEKAGILKPGCPVVVGELPEAAAVVVREKIAAVDCPAVWIQPAQKRGENRAEFAGIEYPLALLGEFQLVNSAIAIAGLQLLRQQGWNITPDAIEQGMGNARWLGRVQWITWRGRKLLLDGAHNPAAARALRHYVDTLNAPIAWVMGILATKESDEIFAALLRPGDRLYCVPVPDHKTTPPEELAEIAIAACPELATCQPCADCFAALNLALNGENPVVLCGSLYLVGDFLKSLAE